MTVKELSDILSGMPEDAEVVICFDVHQVRPYKQATDEYQPADIVKVVYDSTDETVELREAW